MSLPDFVALAVLARCVPFEFNIVKYYLALIKRVPYFSVGAGGVVLCYKGGKFRFILPF